MEIKNYNHKNYTEASKNNLILSILFAIAGIPLAFNLKTKNVPEEQVKTIINESPKSNLYKYENIYDYPAEELQNWSLFQGMNIKDIQKIQQEYKENYLIFKQKEKTPEIQQNNLPQNILARTLFHEARGEGEKGMRAVASVIFNRSKQTGKSISDECLRGTEFCAWRGRDTTYTDESQNYTNPQDVKAWEAANQIAKEMINNTFSPITKADHFHTTNVNPSWSKNQPFELIGNHKFFNIGFKR